MFWCIIFSNTLTAGLILSLDCLRQVAAAALSTSACDLPSRDGIVGRVGAHLNAQSLWCLFHWKLSPRSFVFHSTHDTPKHHCHVGRLNGPRRKHSAPLFATFLRRRKPFSVRSTGEVATCWYVLLSGSVYIDGSMFLPRHRSVYFFFFFFKGERTLVPPFSHGPTCPNRFVSILVPAEDLLGTQRALRRSERWATNLTCRKKWFLW